MGVAQAPIMQVAVIYNNIARICFMDMIIIKGEKLQKLFRKIQRESIRCRGRCAVCGYKPDFDTRTGMIVPFIRHHVSYFPPKTVNLHYQCHRQIHSSTNQTQLIQYAYGDSRKFYELRGKKL